MNIIKIKKKKRINRKLSLLLALLLFNVKKKKRTFLIFRENYSVKRMKVLLLRNNQWKINESPITSQLSWKIRVIFEVLTCFSFTARWEERDRFEIVRMRKISRSRNTNTLLPTDWSKCYSRRGIVNTSERFEASITRPGSYP